MKSDDLSPPSNDNNKNCVSPILRRVFSRSTLFTQNRHPQTRAPNNSNNETHRSESRASTEMTIRSGLSESKLGEDLVIDVTTAENVQFMDQPLRGKIELNRLPAPIESVAISLRGVVKICVVGNATRASGFGGDSNIMARFTEKEVPPY